jgi:hypothetical protein
MADAIENDHTIRKEIGFAKVNGWRKIIKCNVFTLRATDVTELRRELYPIHPDKFFHLEQIAREADVIVVCWGDRKKVPPPLRHNIDTTLAFLLEQGKPVLCFGATAAGDPLHPLMLPYTTELVPFVLDLV